MNVDLKIITILDNCLKLPGWQYEHYQISSILKRKFHFRCGASDQTNQKSKFDFCFFWPCTRAFKAAHARVGDWSSQTRNQIWFLLLWISWSKQTRNQNVISAFMHILIPLRACGRNWIWRWWVLHHGVSKATPGTTKMNACWCMFAGRSTTCVFVIATSGFVFFVAILR